MRIHICLVSSDTSVNTLVRRQRNALIPKEVLSVPRVKNICPSFSLSVYDPKTAGRSLAQYLLENQETQAIALVLDTACAMHAEKITGACFVASVDFSRSQGASHRNYLASTLSRLIKNLANLIFIMNDGSNEQVMLLPFRSFSAQQLKELRETCRNDALSTEFINKVTSLVESLKKRRRPHRKSNYPDQYIVDDNDRLFQYGLERHSRIATGCPHNAVCVLTGSFRFGRRIATDRHFNVTKEHGRETKIEGTFSDCHDQPYVAQATTHLNIFSNDYRA